MKKIFISHKDVASKQAILIKKEFQKYNIDAYLDVLDSNIIDDGEILTKHIRKQLNDCTDIIVLISKETKKSWWVPFEVGMSAQINMPTVIFLKDDALLPDYLSYWPILKTERDMEKYVIAQKKTKEQLPKEIDYWFENTQNKRSIETELFYENLKKELR